MAGGKWHVALQRHLRQLGLQPVRKEINEDFHQGDKVNFALHSGILTEMIKCFRHNDDTIRELASHAVLLVAATEIGRVTLVQNDLVKVIADLFDDKVT